MSTVLDALQELIDRRAMQSVHDSGARGHAAIEAARWRETQQLVECIEELMNTAQGTSLRAMEKKVMTENHKIDEVYGVAYAKWMELRQEGAPAFPPAQAMDQLIDALRAYFRTAQGKTESQQGGSK